MPIGVIDCLMLESNDFRRKRSSLENLCRIGRYIQKRFSCFILQILSNIDESHPDEFHPQMLPTIVEIVTKHISSCLSSKQSFDSIRHLAGNISFDNYKKKSSFVRVNKDE
jgi:hypothetical protein